ncbi:MAG: hypothetical protein HRU03_03640 [Nanoarchaeales archaeon]|nr:hypothetical protein [Nanoarchaeales archaeon]
MLFFTHLGYDVDLLLNCLKSYKYIISNNKFEKFSPISHKSIIGYGEIFKKHYYLRKKIKLNNIDVNMIGKNLMFDKNFNSLKDLSNNDFYFELTNLMGSSRDWDRITRYFIFTTKVYGEGEFSLFIFKKEKLLMIIGFDILSETEIFIKQIQGVEGNIFNKYLDLQGLGIKIVEIWAKNNNFNLISIVGSKSVYCSPYCDKVDSEEMKKKIEEKYDVYADNSGYKLDKKDYCWYKKL